MLGWIFTNIMTAVGTTYGFMTPFVGLMVYYSFAVLRPRFLWFWSWGAGAPRYQFYVAMATLSGWVMMAGMGKWNGLQSISWPLRGFAIYIASGFFTMWFIARSSAFAWTYFYPIVTVTIMMLPTLSLVRDEKTIKTYAWVLMLSLAYLGWNFNVQYLDNPYYLRERGFGGIDNNGVAMIMVMGVPIGFMMGINAKKLWAKGVCFLTVLTLTHVVMFSNSRGGMLGLCMVGFTLFIIAMTQLPNKALTLVLAVAFVAGALYLAGEGVRERFFSIFLDEDELDTSAASRFVTWSAAWECMKDHPLGLGPRNFNLISHQYGLTRNKSVHNLFLQTGADYGFIGLFGMLLFYLGTVYVTFKMTCTATARRLQWPRFYGHMVIISLSGLVVCSTFIGMESVETGYLVSFLGLATVAYVDRVGNSSDPAQGHAIPELAEVPESSEYADLVPA